MSSVRSLLKTLGPGILMAGAAMGVSHLVQSTRAGADYGFSILFLVLVANVLKYPFFEAGHRYTVVTGENLLQGYLRLGRSYLGIFFALNIIASIGTIAGVNFVAAAIIQNLFPGVLDILEWVFVVVAVSVTLLVMGRYHLLDNVIKILMVVLCLSTIIALFVSIYNGAAHAPPTIAPTIWQLSSIPFLIALMGWMPAPIEVSSWQSLWIQAKKRDLGKAMTLQEAKLDFHLGYWTTTVTALMFVALGALVMFGSGVEYADKPHSFAAQFEYLYIHTIGPWAAPIVKLAAFSAIFSTSLTVMDGYSRSIAVTYKTLYPSIRFSERTLRFLWMALTSVFGILLISHFVEHFKLLIDLVTTVAFLSAPVFAWMNYKLIKTLKKDQPSRRQQIITVIGLIYLIGFGVLYLVAR